MFRPIGLLALAAGLCVGWPAAGWAGSPLPLAPPQRLANHVPATGFFPRSVLLPRPEGVTRLALRSPPLVNRGGPYFRRYPGYHFDDKPHLQSSQYVQPPIQGPPSGGR